MGKPTGFIDYARKTSKSESATERTQHFNEFHQHLSVEEQKCQGARCMDCGVPFCQFGATLAGMTSGCPLHNLVPEWNDLVFTGNWEQAYNRLLKTNNFPEFTSRVCPALCEAACTCSLHGDAVAVRENEYAIIEHAYKKGYAKAKPPVVRTGKTVAIVGSGPSGLAAADQLNKRGHSVTVFERSDRIGGLMMYGIPNMKLEKQIVERKVKIMEEEGVIFQTNINVGVDITAKKIVKDFDRVILACGASHPRDIQVEGRDAKGIHFAVDFLSGNTKSLLDSNLADGNFVNTKDKQVVIIGGGDTGNDCVGTAIRHGCKSVIQLEMMSKPPEERGDDNPWPQWPKVLKTDYGQEEAIAKFGKDPRVFETTVKEFVKDGKGNLKSIKTVQVCFVKDAETGKMNLTEVEGSEAVIPADLCFIAAGFLGSEKYISDAFKLEVDMRSNIKANDTDYKTNVENIYAAGDVRRGQSLIVWAIREGREVAYEVDKSLMGYSNLETQ